MADFFEDLKRDLDAATLGPWIVFTPKDYNGPDNLPGLGIENKNGDAVVWYAIGPDEAMQRDEDAALIARAPQLAQLVLLLPVLREMLEIARDNAGEEDWHIATAACVEAIAKFDAAIAEVSQ